jgi:hypothetical protein
MKKSHKTEGKHKIKSAVKSKKQFRNRCLMQDDKQIEATNREIIEMDMNNLKIKNEDEENEDEENEEEENENKENELNNSQNSIEEVKMQKEDFHIKLFMLVYNINNNIRITVNVIPKCVQACDY